MFDVSYSRQATKFLKQADKVTARRIVDEIEKLRLNPFPKDMKRIEDYAEKLFRVRVSDCRILYEVDHQDNLIGIVKIDKRSRVYD